MNCPSAVLFGWSLLLAGPVLAAGPACLPTAATTVIAPGNPMFKAVARQLETLCGSVGLEPKAEGNPSLTQVFNLALAVAPKPRGDRLKPAAPAGMPTGAVMPIGGQIELSANEVADEGILSLDISGPQLDVRLRPMPASGTAQLQASQLRHGEEYRWVLTTRRQKYDGTFSLPDPETTKRTQARLQALATLSASPAALLFLEAAIYDDEELFSSRDGVIARLRRELQKQ